MKIPKNAKRSFKLTPDDYRNNPIWGWYDSEDHLEIPLDETSLTSEGEYLKYEHQFFILSELTLCDGTVMEGYVELSMIDRQVHLLSFFKGNEMFDFGPSPWWRAAFPSHEADLLRWLGKSDIKQVFPVRYRTQFSFEDGTPIAGEIIVRTIEKEAAENPDFAAALVEMTAYREASKPILADLARIGIHLESLSQLHPYNTDDHTIVLLLLKWLPKVTCPDVKQALVGGLAVKSAKPVAAKPLIEEFRRLPASEQSDIKAGICRTLAVVADESVFEDIVELVRDKRQGEGRRYLVRALGEIAGARALPILIELLDDEEVTSGALWALGELGLPEARSEVERFRYHAEGQICNAAKEALAKIDKHLPEDMRAELAEKARIEAWQAWSEVLKKLRK